MPHPVTGAINATYPSIRLAISFSVSVSGDVSQSHISCARTFQQAAFNGDKRSLRQDVPTSPTAVPGQDGDRSCHVVSEPSRPSSISNSMTATHLLLSAVPLQHSSPAGAESAVRQMPTADCPQVGISSSIGLSNSPLPQHAIHTFHTTAATAIAAIAASAAAAASVDSSGGADAAASALVRAAAADACPAKLTVLSMEAGAAHPVVWQNPLSLG